MGYELNRFISHVEESVKCPICNKVFENPVQLDCVGNEFNQHVFCRSCIIERFASSDSLRCPVDGKQFKRNTRRSLFQTPPQHVFDSLSLLQIKCAFASSGCPLILKLTELDAHADACEYNPYRRIMSTGTDFTEAGFYATTYPDPQTPHQHQHQQPQPQQQPNQFQSWFNDFDAWSMQETLQEQQMQQQIGQSKSLLDTERRIENKLRMLDEKYRQKMEEIKNLYEAKLEESNQEQLQRIEAGYQRDIENLRESNQTHLVRLEEKFRREFDGLRRHWAEKETHKPLKKQKFRHVLEEELEEDEAGNGLAEKEKEKEKVTESVGSLIQEEMKKMRKEIHEVWSKNFEEYKSEREKELRGLRDEVGSFIEEMKKNQAELKKSIGKEMGDLRKSIQEKGDSKKLKINELKDDYEKQVRDIMCMHLDQIDAIVEKFEKCKEQLKNSCKQDVKKLQVTMKNHEMQVKKLKQQLKLSGKEAGKSAPQRDQSPSVETAEERTVDTKPESEERQKTKEGREVRAMPPRGVKRKAAKRGPRAKRSRSTPKNLVDPQTSGNKTPRLRKQRKASEAATASDVSPQDANLAASSKATGGVDPVEEKKPPQPAVKENRAAAKGKERRSAEKENPGEESKPRGSCESEVKGQDNPNSSAKKEKSNATSSSDAKTEASATSQLGKPGSVHTGASTLVSGKSASDGDSPVSDQPATVVSNQAAKSTEPLAKNTDAAPAAAKELTKPEMVVNNSSNVTTVAPTAVVQSSSDTMANNHDVPQTIASTTVTSTMATGGIPSAEVPSTTENNAATISSTAVTNSTSIKATSAVDNTTDLLAKIVNEVILEDSLLNAEMWEQNLLRKPVPPPPNPLAKTVSLYYNFKTDSTSRQTFQIPRPSGTRTFDPRIISDIRPATAPPAQCNFTSAFVKPLFDSSISAATPTTTTTTTVSPTLDQNNAAPEASSCDQEERTDKVTIDADMDVSTDVSNDSRPASEAKMDSLSNTNESDAAIVDSKEEGPSVSAERADTLQNPPSAETNGDSGIAHSEPVEASGDSKHGDELGTQQPMVKEGAAQPRKPRARAKRMRRRHSAPIARRKKSIDVPVEIQPLEAIEGAPEVNHNHNTAQLDLIPNLDDPIFGSASKPKSKPKKIRSKSVGRDPLLVKTLSNGEHSSAIEGKSFVIEPSPPEKRKRGRPRKGESETPRVPALKIRIKGQMSEEKRTEEKGQDVAQEPRIPAPVESDAVPDKPKHRILKKRALPELVQDVDTTMDQIYPVRKQRKRRMTRRKSNDYVKRRRVKRRNSGLLNNLPKSETDCTGPNDEAMKSEPQPKLSLNNNLVGHTAEVMELAASVEVQIKPIKGVLVESCEKPVRVAQAKTRRVPRKRKARRTRKPAAKLTALPADGLLLNPEKEPAVRPVTMETTETSANAVQQDVQEPKSGTALEKPASEDSAGVVESKETAPPTQEAAAAAQLTQAQENSNSDGYFDNIPNIADAGSSDLMDINASIPANPELVSSLPGIEP